MRQPLRSLEIAAWCLGLICTSTLAIRGVEANSARKVAASLGGQPGSTDQGSLSPAAWVPTSKTRSISNPNQVLGRLEIPALKLVTPIVDNADDDSLMLGAGHVRGTAMPGGLGNFVIAAHRDTYFRPLAGIHAGMRMQVVTADSTYVYVVDGTRIVLPDEVDVLDMGDVPQMTLITCYPFHYVGSAPKRFVVRAHLLNF